MHRIYIPQQDIENPTHGHDLLESLSRHVALPRDTPVLCLKAEASSSQDGTHVQVWELLHHMVRIFHLS